MPLLMLLPILGGALFLRRFLALNDSGSLLISVSSILLLTYPGIVGDPPSRGLSYLRTGYPYTGMGTEIVFSFPKVFFSLTPTSFSSYCPSYTGWSTQNPSRCSGMNTPIGASTSVRWLQLIPSIPGDTNASHPDYPPGAAVWQYLFILIPSYGEGTVYLAQFVLLMTPLLVLLKTLNSIREFGC